MANIVFNGTPIQAANLIQFSTRMTIPAHAEARESARAKLNKAWPELTKGIKDSDPLLKERRKITLDAEEQTALGLGLWDLFLHKDTQDGDRILIKDLFKQDLLWLSGWLKEKLANLTPIKELLRSDEDPVSDPIIELHNDIQEAVGAIKESAREQAVAAAGVKLRRK